VNNYPGGENQTKEESKQFQLELETHLTANEILPIQEQYTSLSIQ
jgi:hypothetical protein